MYIFGRPSNMCLVRTYVSSDIPKEKLERACEAQTLLKNKTENMILRGTRGEGEEEMRREETCRNAREEGGREGRGGET